MNKKEMNLQPKCSFNFYYFYKSFNPQTTITLMGPENKQISGKLQHVIPEIVGSENVKGIQHDKDVKGVKQIAIKTMDGSGYYVNTNEISTGASDSKNNPNPFGSFSAFTENFYNEIIKALQKAGYPNSNFYRNEQGKPCNKTT